MQDLVWANISTQALKHNFQFCNDLAKDAKIITVIKADGYGHGAYTTALTLTDSDYFAVARINEAIKLRQQGITTPVMVLSGILNFEDLKLCAKYDIDAVIHTPAVLDIISLRAHLPTLNIWLKVDTGMHRLGISPQQLDKALSTIELCKELNFKGVISHFSSADEPDHSSNQHQRQQFESIVNSHNISELSFANSAALLHCPDAHYDYIRPGIMIYGVNPSPEISMGANLKPVMTLQAKVLNVREILAGETVGYSGIWQAEKNSLIATIAVGYADGYPRHAKIGTPVLIQGREFPLVGRVSMDLITVDISGSENIGVGCNVTLWGEGLPVERIAQCSDTIAYQLLTAVSNRVPRIIV